MLNSLPTRAISPVRRQTTVGVPEKPINLSNSVMVRWKHFSIKIRSEGVRFIMRAMKEGRNWARARQMRIMEGFSILGKRGGWVLASVLMIESGICGHRVSRFAIMMRFAFVCSFFFHRLDPTFLQNRLKSHARPSLSSLTRIPTPFQLTSP